MHTSVIVVLCCAVGLAACYNVQRDLPYNTGPIDYNSIEIIPSVSLEPSQRLFWGEQGSNQVGGSGLWATLTNKFPFLNRFSGRMELPTSYGVPQVSQYYATPQYQQQYQAQNQRLVPSTRDVGFTDDAVIITPPQVPILPQPAPQPIPQPVPQPIPQPIPQPAPVPSPQPSPGYHYAKPLYRLELPRK